jgi:acetylornithine deacetylase/succinyl-diaminopimelate desuccinylase-like protein
VQSAVEYIRQHTQDHLKWTTDLCRIPSISTKPEHKEDVRRAVQWTRDLCERVGLSARVMETGGHPLVFAELCQAPGAPTYLVYGHVDVQPTGDLSLWEAGPFEPVVRDGWLICRGSSDDKGQVLLYLRAAEAWLRTEKKLPVNLKLLIEGEEEIGSPNLAPFIEKHRDLLRCDAILISDTGLLEDGLPTITCGTRGLVYKEIRLSGPRNDLHSGTHGGAVANPALMLARLLASMHDENNRVTIPGFYDQVAELTPEQRKDMAAAELDEKKYAAELGVTELWEGERGYSAAQRRSIRPTCEINGIFGGYMGEGANTIIPARAGAKVSLRLVPNQPAAEISRRFDETVRQRCPKSVRVEILTHGPAVDAYVTPPTMREMQAARQALKETFGREPAMIREGGSLPILPMFKRVLGADSLMLGFASPSCNAHGPNEKVLLADLDRGAETITRLFGYLGS